MSDNSFIEFLRHESDNRTNRDWKLLPKDNDATGYTEFPPESYDGGVFRGEFRTDTEGVVRQLEGTQSYFIRKDLYTRTVEKHTEEYNKGEKEERFLWGQFCNDFFAWSEEWFKKVEKSALTKLRDTLRSRGVYVNQSEDVVNALYNTLVRRGSPVWPDDDTWSMKPNYASTREFDEIDRRWLFGEKFSGREKNPANAFSRIRGLFIERCVARGVPEKNWYVGFNIMLKGSPLAYYRETLRGRDLDFEDLCQKLVDRYGLDERR